MLRLLLALLPFLLAASAMGQGAKNPYRPSPPMHTSPVPENATVSLLLPDSPYFIGDSIWAIFQLKNVGNTEFSYNTGGDYQGTGFPLRCIVIVKNADRNEVPGRVIYSHIFGGRAQTRPLKPGEKFDQQIPILGFAMIDTPGHYTVSVFHDFGWDETAEIKFPVAEGAFDIVMPTEKQAAEIVSKKLSQELAPVEITWLSNPIFLVPLQNQAEAGNVNAVTGIESIETRESTAALIKLLSNPNAKIVNRAAQALIYRLPNTDDRPFDRKPGELSVLTRDSKQEDIVRQLGAKFLNSDNDQLHMYGLRFLQSVGKSDDIPTISSALQRVLDREQNQTPKTDASDKIDIKPYMLAAASDIFSRGARTDGKGSDADSLLFLCQLASANTPRPDAEISKAAIFTALDKPAPLFRQIALVAIPQPITDEWIPTIIRYMNDPSNEVAETACGIAGKSKKPQFIAPLLKIMNDASEARLIAASGAAWQLGSRLKLWDFWANKLTNKKYTYEAEHVLTHVIAEVDSRHTDFSGTANLTHQQALTLRKAWERFLKTHRKELAEGKRYSYKDPVVRPLMGFAADGNSFFTFGLEDGRQWPERTK
ncbi:MAG: HEAT repeat domain-containing protein [Chthoniobacterales bacterium]